MCIIYYDYKHTVLNVAKNETTTIATKISILKLLLQVCPYLKYEGHNLQTAVHMAQIRHGLEASKIRD